VKAADTTLLHGELRLAGRLDARFFALLQAVHDSGSIQRAARAAGYSYRGAWLVLEAASNLAQTPLLHTQTGGARGGGTRLTAEATGLLAVWARLAAEHGRFLQQQDRWLAAEPALATLLKRMSMKTTARNQFAGTVKAVVAGPVTSQVHLALPGGEELVATLTTTAAKRMKLKKGAEAIALVKASSVVLVSDFAGWQVSAQNQFAGTVSRIEKGAVSSCVVLALPGGALLTATVTQDAVVALGLKAGQAATAVFKASAVMLAVSG
jgi:molybdate transport system regulatory protein